MGFFSVIDLFFLKLVITHIPSICLPSDLLKFGGISIKMLLKVHPPCFFYTKLSLHKLSLVERQGKKNPNHCVCEEYFPLVLKQQLRNVPFILPKPMFTFLNTFDYFSLSTHSIFQILLIAFIVILCLLVLDIYHLQWMLDYTWGWDKLLENREGKSESLQYLSHFPTIQSFFFFWRNMYGKNTLMKLYYCFKS